MFVGAKLNLRIITSKKCIHFHWDFFPHQKCKQKNSGKEGFRSSSACGGYLSEAYFWFQECKEWVCSSMDCSLCPQSVTQENAEYLGKAKI